jgi:hypothetical protein
MDDSELEEYCEKNPQLHRVLTQIQSDIQVNEDLVGQLERTEIEYGQMRKKFEKKLYSLREEILTLRQQQKEATTKHTSLAQSKDAVVAHREKLHMNDVRHAYEAKMKTLMSQLSDLRRKYTATSSTIQSSRNQNESMLRALRVSVESLKDEKRRMVRKMKNEAERVKEQMHHHEREIQQLRRRQMKDAETKRRLEREGKQLNLILQKKTDESVITGEKLKRLIQILKKAVREGGVLDEKSLASCGSILDVGNALVQYSHVNRLSRKRKAPKKNRIPLQERTAKKKQLLDQALAQFIQGKQAVEEMKQLLSKRNALAQKKAEYLSEREMLLIDQDRQSYTIDRAITQAIDDNIETVEAEISYLNARIQSIHNDAANEIMQEDEADPVVDMSSRPEKRVTFADKMPNEKKDPENEWLDMDALEESYSISPNASPERCIDTIEKLLKSITADESSLIMENMVDDILLLRIEDYNSKMTFQQLEKTAQDLRCTLFVMKKAAIETTVENEKKIKRLQGSRRTSLSNLSLKSGNLQSSIHTEDGSDSDSAIDLYPEEQYQHIENMFDKIYNDGINGNILNSSWSEYHISRPTSPTIDVAPSPKLRPQIPQALSGKLGVNAPMKPSTSPLANRRNSNSSPEQFLQQFPQSFGGKLGTTAPMKPSISPLVHRRNSMSSPEQFLQQLLQTPKDVRPPPSPRMKPAEFARYQADRESSTSSIRSRNPRRTSIQSDSGSLPSIYPGNQSHKMTRASSGSKLPSNTDMSGVASNTNPPTAILNRRRAFSFQQPPSPTPTNMRRRSLLREMSYGYEEPKSPQKQQFQDLRDGSAARDYTNGTSLIPAFNNMGLASRPSSVLTLPTQPKLAKALPLRRDSSPSCSYELRRSSVNNVFDRLSSGHTQASQAKAKSNNYRYSTSNIEDLKRQWNSNEMEDEYAM